MPSYRPLLLGSLVLTLAAGCGDSGSDASSTATPDPGNTGLSQPGAQDFGLFRKILEAGGIPGPDTLDDLGFFAEHKLEYPEPACGEDACLHGMLGVMGNMIEGSTCTLLHLGMNTPIDPETVERPPMHLVLAIDVSGSMAGPPLDFVKAGLKEMVPALDPADTVSLVAYADTAKVYLDAAPATEAELILGAIESLYPSGATNLYDGLFTSLALADAHFSGTAQNRVIFLSDGVATAGLQSSAKLVSLARGYAEKGVNLTTIGVGAEFDVDVMRDLSEVGAGNFYFLEDPKAVKEVFADEVSTFLFPIALDVEIAVDVASSYEIRAVYGTNGWTAESDASGRVEIASLFLAGRQSDEEPIEPGRRGGGGAILLELVPKLGVPEVPGAVAALEMRYESPVTGEIVTQHVGVASPVGPNQAPEDGYFDNATVEKGFVMLNLFAGFQMATRFAADSDLFTARRTLEALRPNVAAWLDENPDLDIEDDLRYVDLFLANIETHMDSTVVYVPNDPPTVWPAD